MSLDIQIKVTGDSQAESAARRVESALDRVETAGAQAGAKASQGMRDTAREADKAKKATSEFGDSLKKAAAMAGLTFGAKQVLDMADSYTSLRNRLRQVAPEQAQLNALMSQMQDIATRTRSDISTTGESFVRLMMATKQLGLSQERGLKITETLNMALQSSGASTSEAASGTLQLMQAMSAGALAGDEFKSIAENIPVLMDVLAKQLGVTRGELKKMGAEGKITTDIMVKGLEAYADTAKKTFDESEVTFGQAVTIAKNYAKEVAGSGISINKIWKERFNIMKETNLAEMELINTMSRGNKWIGQFTTSVGQLSAAQYGAVKSALLWMETTTQLERSLGQLADMMKVIKAFEKENLLKSLGAAYGGPVKGTTDKAPRERTSRAPRMSDGPSFRSHIDSAPRSLTDEADERIRRELEAAGKEYLEEEERRKAKEQAMQESLRDQRIKMLEEEEKKMLESQKRMADGFKSIADEISQMAFDGQASVNDMMRRIWMGMFRTMSQQAIGSSFGLPGFASGGSFMVGGHGGTDTTPIAFMATPGERVTVETGGQQRDPDPSGGASGAPMHVTIHLDERDAARAMETPEGQRVIVKVVKRMFPGLRSGLLGR